MLSSEITINLISGLKKIFEDKLCLVVLYGSVARKEETSDSDIDIAVIIKDDLTESQKKLFIEFMSTMDLQYDRVFSMVDINLEQYNKWGDILPFYRNIKKDGIVLWKAA